MSTASFGGERGMSRAIRIAVASGKGGTGKTTIATSLATVMAEPGEAVAYIDCDVEEPNGHIFLNPAFNHEYPVTTTVPEIDQSRCTLCGACARACRFSALLALPDQVLTFPELCHGCGGCVLACPELAIRERPRPVGIVSTGTAGRVAVRQGTLNVGEARTTTLVRETIDAAPAGHALILDAPPGTSCPVVETMREADVVLLVTEPTPFGLHDLSLAVSAVRRLGLPLGVAVNRAGIGDRKVFDYCLTQAIPVLLELPNDRRIAEAYSRGELAVRALPELALQFSRLASRLHELAGHPPEAVALRPWQRRPPLVAPHQDHLDRPNDREATDPAPPRSAGTTAAKVRELVVLSGKGGTGKTSIAASFLALAATAADGMRPGGDGPIVVADCDVDAPDLGLVVTPTIRKSFPFSGGETATIDANLCTACGLCADQCRFDAIDRDVARQGYSVDPLACEGCGVCERVCPEQAIRMDPADSGEWLVSDTRYGPMVHARLHPAQGNSGKLVSLVRSHARATAAETGRDLLLCDGPPGVGCPAIASVTGASLALIVTEPTRSGLHDLRRAAGLTSQFAVPTGVCVNKWDINPDLTQQLEAEADALGLVALGRVRYDESVTKAQLRATPVVAASNGPAAEDIRDLWRRVLEELNRGNRPYEGPKSVAGLRWSPALEHSD